MKLLITIVFIVASLFIHTPAQANVDQQSVVTEQTQHRIIDINQADVETLSLLKGVGEKKAQAIIEYREQYGEFKSIDELLNVKGIGERLLAVNKDKITL